MATPLRVVPSITGIDPNNSQRIVEEYANGRVAGTIDGGKNWAVIDPQLTSPQFSTPLTLDPLNADHLQAAGREVVQTPYPYTMHCVGDPSIPPAVCPAYDNWTTVFDLGTEPVLGKNRSSTAGDLYGNASYVGYCGPCSARTTAMFRSGLATNVGGSAPGSFLSSDGWHLVAATGLPQRYITSIWIDRSDPTDYLYALGGYGAGHDQSPYLCCFDDANLGGAK